MINIYKKKIGAPKELLFCYEFYVRECMNRTIQAILFLFSVEGILI